ncbi:hypothetical protein M9H77_14792 [Catharanthus roseus]|uniref:Uncharacterized protein n=1 Tax=Catharanthus roseus TaxID=4058 RepID=A0ACC0BPA7_CATRO|nr:hypothetical protein M9H77_14792 [Catharanthus roseus]
MHTHWSVADIYLQSPSPTSKKKKKKKPPTNQKFQLIHYNKAEMWRTLWRSIDRFSLHYFKYVIDELRAINVVDWHNRVWKQSFEFHLANMFIMCIRSHVPLIFLQEVVEDLLQSIVEIVTYGQSHNPSIFECFMEFQVLSEFVRLLDIAGNSGIEAPLLQYLSIMIQNMDNKNAIYKGVVSESCFTEKIRESELLPPDAMRGQEGKLECGPFSLICLTFSPVQNYCLSNGYINRIITHQFKFDGGDLVPYYISFLRAVTAKIDKDTICLLVKVHQDAVVSFPLYAEALKFAHYGEKMIQIAVRAITLNVYNVADDMVYQHLTTPPVSEYFSSLFLSLRKKCFQVDALVSGPKETWHERKQELIFRTDGIVDDLYYIKDVLCIGDHRLSSLITHNMVDVLIVPVLLPPLHVRRSNGTCLSAITSLYVLSCVFQVCGGSSFSSLPLEITQTKGEILYYISSSNCRLMLASLMLLFIVAETKDVDHELAVMIDQIKRAAQDSGSTNARNIKKIVDALLKVLASESPCSVPMLVHTAWLLRKLLTSYDLAYGRICEEFRGCWYDFIPDTLRNEWAECKADAIFMGFCFGDATALDESSHSKDPFFVLDLEWSKISANNNTSTSSAKTMTHPAIQIPGSLGSAFDWQQMVDAVKLKSSVLGDDHIDIPFEKLKMSSLHLLEKRYTSDLSSASFGSEVALGHGIPCTIAFSKAGTRDIYVIPVAKEGSGKLLLVEQHPLHYRKGVVIAIAPLAGLNPKIDENHPTWLHLRLREFEPSFDVSKNGTFGSKTRVGASKGRWTLGFRNADYCSAAYSAILEEARKQRTVNKDAFWQKETVPAGRPASQILFIGTISIAFPHMAAYESKYFVLYDYYFTSRKKAKIERNVSRLSLDHKVKTLLPSMIVRRRLSEL